MTLCNHALRVYTNTKGAITEAFTAYSDRSYRYDKKTRYRLRAQTGLSVCLSVCLSVKALYMTCPLLVK